MRQGTRGWAWALIVLGLLAVATALALLLGGRGGEVGEGSATTAPAPPATSSEAGPGGPATPSSAGSPRITSSVRLGDGCLAAEHGTQVRGVDGRHLVCTWGDGASTWTEVAD